MASELNRIVVYRAGDRYLVRHEGPHASTIFELYGTDTLPTGWSGSTPVDDVVREFRRRNPGWEVVALEPDNPEV